MMISMKWYGTISRNTFKWIKYKNIVYYPSHKKEGNIRLYTCTCSSVQKKYRNDKRETKEITRLAGNGWEGKENGLGVVGMRKN